jgi:ABC-2 type transport system permease protein
MFFKTIGFTLLRMLRNYIGIILLLVVPLALISVLSLVAAYSGVEEQGISAMEWISVSFVLSFQLFGGAYVMEILKEDLFSPRKWRIYSLPTQIHSYAGSIFAASTLFSALQGLVIVLFTKWIYGVNWGNLAFVLLVILSISILSQLVCLILLLSVRKYKVAERLSEVYGIGSMVFAGMMITLPDTAFFNFMAEYGNPISLGRKAIFSMISGADPFVFALPIVILLSASSVLAVVAILLGRRRLA